MPRYAAGLGAMPLAPIAPKWQAGGFTYYDRGISRISNVVMLDPMGRVSLLHSLSFLGGLFEHLLPVPRHPRHLAET